jgi:hypothetical protein
MSEHSVIAWDLETVPDLKAVARMIDMEGEADEKVRAALGSGFPKHPLHKIVCIGALVASRQPEGWQVDARDSITPGKPCQQSRVAFAQAFMRHRLLPRSTTSAGASP